MDLGQSFDRSRNETATSGQELTQSEHFSGLVLPPATIDSDSSEIKLAIEERIRNIAARVTGRSPDSFAILDGRPEELALKSSAESSLHRKNEFFLVDLNATSLEQSFGTPAILHAQLVIENGRTLPIIRPYGDIMGELSLETAKLCEAIYQDFGLSVDSQKALADRQHVATIEVPSSLTPFKWSANDVILGIVSHLSVTPLIYCALQAAYAPSADNAGWIVGCMAAFALAGTIIYGFWNRIDYLQRRPHIASLIEHLHLTDDRKALRSAVQGTIDHDTLKLLIRYVTDKKSVPDSVALAHAVAKIGIAEISHPRKIEYWSYDSDARKDKLYWEVIDQTLVFGWLSKIGGSSSDPAVQKAVHSARAELESFLADRR